MRTLIKNDFLNAFKNCDAIITPTAPTPAFALGEKVDDPLAMYLNDIYTVTQTSPAFPGSACRADCHPRDCRSVFSCLDHTGPNQRC